MPTPQKHHLDYVDHCKSPTLSFFFQPVQPKELRSEISLVPNDKSYGLYSSPTKLFKCSSTAVAPVLSEILNTSIRLGTYPSKLKIAKNYTYLTIGSYVSTCVHRDRKHVGSLESTKDM